MARFWPVLAVAAAAIAAAVLWLGDDPEEHPGFGDAEVVGYDEQGNPILLTTKGRPRPKRPPPPKETPEEIAHREAERVRNERVLFLQGLVVSQDGGAPMAGIYLWAEWSLVNCPRIPSQDLGYGSRTESLFDAPRISPGIDLSPARTSTGEDGRFRWEVHPSGVSTKGRYDVFVSAPGYVTQVLCRPSKGSDVTLRMQKALQLPVRVTDIHGRPIEGTLLTIEPAEGTEAVPGHGGVASTDENGSAEIDGLLPGDVMLKADHPAYMLQTIGPLDPAAGIEITVRLAPALRMRFEIRSDDASAIKDPVLAWGTDGSPPHKGLTILKATPNGPPTQPHAEVHTEPVRIPCDHRNVQLTLKADGFEPWSPELEPLPADGGERTVVVSLARDTSLASLRIHFKDEKGKPVSYVGLQPVPSITRMDGVAMPSGIKLESGEDLVFPSLPAGPYRFGVSGPRYAPVELDVTVVAGEANEATAQLSPAAKLRVRFTAAERMLVRFRLVRDGQVLRAFPENAQEGQATDPARPLVAHGNEGAVFTGLPAGPCILEVTSPGLVATSRSIRLRAGETADVEMEVRLR